MSAQSYRFMVGTIECVAVLDGERIHRGPGSALFASAPRGRLAQVLRAHGLDAEQWGEVLVPYICVAVDTGRHRVLVDTGMGNWAPTTGRLIRNLRAEGIDPQAIDTVVLTHGHGDHIGGNTDGAGRPTFPNARYVMRREEWELWADGPAPAQPATRWTEFVRAQLLPLRDRFDLVDREMEIVPGIQIVDARGHTPGHLAVAVTSGNEQLLCLGDAALHPIHVEQPTWYGEADRLPEQVVASRRRLLERAAGDRALTHCFHFPFPGLGYVISKGDAWQWQPVEARR